MLIFNSWIVQISKEFSAAHPDKVRSMQLWDEVHEKTLRGYELHSDDIAVQNDPEHFGLLSLSS